MIDATTSLDFLYAEAKLSLKNITVDDREFIVSDLFSLIEWRRIPLEIRMALGSKILVDMERSNDFEIVSKDDLGRQIYRKR